MTVMHSKRGCTPLEKSPDPRVRAEAAVRWTRRSLTGFTPSELVFAIALVVFFASVSVALLSAIDRAARADQARAASEAPAGENIR